MNNHIISGLSTKRAELLGKIAYHKKEIKILLENLSQISKTMQIIDPEIKLSPKSKAYREYNKHFKNGELSKLVLEVLRDSESGLTVYEIIDKIKEIKEIDDISEMSVRNCLNNYAKKDIVKRTVVGDRKEWIVANEKTLSDIPIDYV